METAGEVMEMGRGDGCRQKGGRSAGRRRCRLQSFPPLESGGVEERTRVPFGSLINMMKFIILEILLLNFYCSCMSSKADNKKMISSFQRLNAV